jgi:hypothetical protein
MRNSRKPLMKSRANIVSIKTASTSLDARVGRYDWRALTTELDLHGCAVMEKLLEPEECASIAALYAREEHFRSHIHMARHGFGKGEYRYFKYPLPDLVGDLRTALYPRLASVANGWNELSGMPERYPDTHAEFLTLCHGAGQTRPTPLLLQYGPGDFNCLHQDLYGDLAFPIQVAILLSKPGHDFSGGEFVLTEQRPRNAEPGRSRPPYAGRCRRLRRPQPAGSGKQGQLPRQHAPRSQPCALRQAPHGRDHFSRRPLRGRCRQGWIARMPRTRAVLNYRSAVNRSGYAAHLASICR